MTRLENSVTTEFQTALEKKEKKSSFKFACYTFISNYFIQKDK